MARSTAAALAARRTQCEVAIVLAQIGIQGRYA